MKTSNLRQHSHQEGIVIEKFYGSIHHIVSIWKPRPVEFLCHIDKHFPRHHKNRNLLNRNNIKTSYTWIPKRASVTRNHNTSLLTHATSTNMKECAGRQKTECLLDKKWLSVYLVYNTLVGRLDTSKTEYFDGTCKKNFKERYNDHTGSFRNQNKEKSTVFPKYIWELKHNNMQHNLKWYIASKGIYAEVESVIYPLRKN